MKFSPLFWPVKLEKDTIYVLDEIRLPHKVSYIRIKNYKQACKAIREMKTRAGGQVLLVMYAFLLEYKRLKGNKNPPTQLKKIALEFNASRPTLSFKILTDMVLKWASDKAPLDKRIAGFLQQLKQRRVLQAQKTCELIKDKVHRKRCS